jgi:hypothetical protein
MSIGDLVAAFAPEQRTLPAMLETQAHQWGDRLLLVTGPVRLSFDQIRMMAACSAGHWPRPEYGAATGSP